jgi:hypothetical protein
MTRPSHFPSNDRLGATAETAGREEHEAILASNQASGPAYECGKVDARSIVAPARVARSASADPQ